MAATSEKTAENAPKNTMKAIHVHEFVSDFEKIGKSMTLETNVERPVLKKDELLIRVLACSISPGDIIMVKGNLVFLHPGKFPFVPGMDVCGVVEEANGVDNFSKGDIVVASNGMSAQGGMAEFMAVPKLEAVLKPPSVSTQEAAASSSAITARNAVLDNVKEGDRVLILGGSGGVGSAAIQLAKTHAKASFVATTSTQSDLCQSLGADRIINYSQENWWEIKDYQEDKFDVIVDTVGGGNFVDKADQVLKTRKQGGTFVAVTGDDTKPQADTWWKAIQFFANLPLRPIYTWYYGSTLPGYVLLMPYDIPEGRKQVLKMMEQKTLRILIDEKCPLPFTDEGVREAFGIVASGHAHCKVVVSITGDES